MLRNSLFLIKEYLVQTKKKWFASSWGAPQLHAGLDKIWTLCRSWLRKEAVHKRFVSIYQYFTSHIRKWNLHYISLLTSRYVRFLVYNYFIWSMIQRGSDTSFTNLWSLLLYIQSLLHYIENAQENKKNTILSYNIAALCEGFDFVDGFGSCCCGWIYRQSLSFIFYFYLQIKTILHTR
jgi:hypothetical protein